MNENIFTRRGGGCLEFSSVAKIRRGVRRMRREKNGRFDQHVAAPVCRENKKKKKEKSRDSLPFPFRNRDTVYIRCNICILSLERFRAYRGAFSNSSRACPSSVTREKILPVRTFPPPLSTNFWTLEKNIPRNYIYI